MAFSEEKKEELKQIIHRYMSRGDIQAKLQAALAKGTYTTTSPEEDVLDMLDREGVTQEIVSQFNIPSSKKKRSIAMPTDVQAHPVNYLRRQLFLQILGGRAFLEHLQDEDPLPGQQAPTLTLHVHFRDQRFRSQPAQCACDPDIRDGFLLELHRDGEANQMLDSTDLLSLCDPVHLVLVKTDTVGEPQLMSSHYLDWRNVLASPDCKVSMAVEILGIGGEAKVPVGVLNLSLELLPKCTALSDEVLSTQMALERSRQAERERLFLAYSKQWWREYLQIRGAHAQRLVKIFAQDENLTNRPVSSFVRPLRGGRLLDGPRHAARFVSLVRYDRPPAVGHAGSKSEQWMSLHAFLANNKGDCENHATLLCSLLLGFGLDAYVCLGTKGKGAAHAWVATIGPSDGSVTFWESLNGNRYTHMAASADDMITHHPPPKPKHPYRTIGSVFNHQAFYANIQVTDQVEFCQFALDDDSCWKAMSADAIASVCGMGVSPVWTSVPSLQRSPYDASVLSNEIEIELRRLMVEYRLDIGLATTFDDHMSYILSMALSSYEHERLTGLTAGTEEFKQAVTLSVPEGHTFKGYPIQFSYINARRAFAASLRSTMCQEIVGCKGDSVRLAVRVRLFTYPETACALWIMYACKYKCIL